MLLQPIITLQLELEVSVWEQTADTSRGALVHLPLGSHDLAGLDTCRVSAICQSLPEDICTLPGWTHMDEKWMDLNTPNHQPLLKCSLM